MKTQKLRWRADLALLCILGMEITWFTPWAVLLSGSGSSPMHRVPWFVWLGLLLLAMCLARALPVLKLPMGFLLAIGASVGLIALYGYAGYPAERSSWLSTWQDNLLNRGSGLVGLYGMALPLLASYCVVRGTQLADRRVTAQFVRERLVAGAVAWLLYSALAMLLNRPPVSPGWAFAFVALAVVASGLARLEEALRGRVASRAAASGFWTAMVVACAGALTGAGVLVASIASGFLAGALSRAIGGLQSLHREIPKWVDWFIETFFPLGVVYPEPQPTPTPGPLAGAPSLPEGIGFPWWLVVAATVGIVVWVVAAFAPRTSKPSSLAPSEWDAARVDYQRGLRGLLRRLRGAGSRGPKPEVQLASVRQIYGSVLRLAAWRGTAREERETPYEFQQRLDDAQPEVQAPLGEITDAYVRARYGGVELTDAEVERLRAEWERVRVRMEE